MALPVRLVSRKETSHARIVEVASRAIRQFGYQGTGVADIMKAAGLTHGGFYAHFENRDALVREAIDHAGTTSLEALTASIDKQRARGASSVEALISSYLSDSHLAAVDGGCPIAALVGETPRQAEAVQDASRRRLMAFLERVRRQLPSAGPRPSAESLTCALIGTLQVARAIGSNKAGRSFLASRREELIRVYDRPSR